MPIIPNPEQARELRTLFQGHPTIDEAEVALRAFGVPRLPVGEAFALLPHWRRAALLSDQERAAVIARFVPEPADTCAVCGEAIRYITDGPTAGWWSHVTIIEGPDVHGAVPSYPDIDPDDPDGSHWYVVDEPCIAGRAAAMAARDRPGRWVDLAAGLTTQQAVADGEDDMTAMTNAAHPVQHDLSFCAGLLRRDHEVAP